MGDKIWFNEETARGVMYAVVEWLHDNGKIPESTYGKMTIDGDGPDAEALIAEIMHVVES